ncbi:TRAP transporter substrate-binding protein [Ideonella sp. A 288]|uniref:TRAP transporter substrate-binding protein n=1 Tax=Ideonella sp. A 288 TaxID=1962181 RepID=UPI000B4BD72F|nr:TRAP transporter substrate-binding protein [Ideonella sp. A 288]
MTAHSPRRPGWPVRIAVAAAALLVGQAAQAQPAGTPAPQHLRIVGGLAGVNQFTRHEEPFWAHDLKKLSNGRASAEIVPFDRAGIRGQDMLRLMTLGVVPFGTALLGLSVAEMPIVAAPELAGLSPDMATLRRTVSAFRPHLEKTLRERHGIEVLAIYTYPAQVVYCTKPFNGLAGLAGRRVRVSGPSQSDMVQALGGQPVPTPFADIMTHMRSGNLDCAITGTMSGNTIGLHEVTSHLHTMAVTWGLAMFGANAAAWQALPADLQALLRRELRTLEQSIWDESDRETGQGVACNTGQAACTAGKRGRMVEVKASPEDERRRQTLLAETVLPRWLQRCGPDCAEVWNRTIGPVVSIPAKAP